MKQTATITKFRGNKGRTGLVLEIIVGIDKLDNNLAGDRVRNGKVRLQKTKTQKSSESQVKWRLWKWHYAPLIDDASFEWGRLELGKSDFSGKSWQSPLYLNLNGLSCILEVIKKGQHWYKGVEAINQNLAASPSWR